MNLSNSDLCPPVEPPERAPPRRGGRPAGGFTLVELLTALAILSVALAIAWGTFAAVLTAWRRGEEYLATLRTADSAADEIAAALRSAFYRRSDDGRYGFHLETDARGEAVQFVRWTSLGGPAVPNAAVPAGLPRRLTLAIETDADDQPRAVLRAAPAHRPSDDEQPDPVARIWPEIVRFSCRLWNEADECWETTWENTNAIPSRVELILWTRPHPEGDLIEARRQVELMVFQSGGVIDDSTAERRRRRAQAPSSEAATPVPVRSSPPRP